MTQVKEFLDALRSNPEAGRIFEQNGKEKPDSREEIAEVYADVAKELGYDLTPAQILEGIDDLEKAQAAGSDQAAEIVQKIEMDELEKVAGGVVIPEEKCKDTFKDKENCWFNDGCDYTINSYNTYKCKHLPH